MLTREDLESYLIRLGADFEEVDDGMFLVGTDNGGAPIVSITRSRSWSCA